MINVDKIYNLLADKGFQEPRTGNLLFPAYVYTYQPEQEYQIREQIELLVKKLKRPNNFLDCLSINIYHELIDYLKAESFAGDTLFDLVLEKEKENPTDALQWVIDEINVGDFYDRIAKKVKEHFNPSEEKRVYLIVSGFGSVYPYLRASDFLKKTEQLIKDFKIILFYPGEYKESKYSMFCILNDDNMYRANHLNQQIGEEIQ